MSERQDIRLERVTAAEQPQFTEKLQQAFAVAVREKFGTTDPIPSTDEVYSSFHACNTDTYHILWRGRRTGGAVVSTDEASRRNSLELFFISPEHHSRGIGLAAWQAIEAAYPQAAVWETVTPYFEERNINFYVNKCGFHIVDFFNAHHVDPEADGTAEPGTDAYFRFEKVMR